MKKIIASILALSLLISGCSYNISKEKFEEKERFYTRINKILDQNECMIYTMDQRTYVGREIKVMVDSTSFYDVSKISRLVLPTNHISEIRIKGTGSSIFEGFLFGGIAGGILGNIISNPSSPGLEKAVSVLGGIGIGGIIGILVSLIYPSYTIILFNF